VEGQRVMFDGGLPLNKNEIEELKKFTTYIKESKLPYDKRLYFFALSLVNPLLFLNISKELDLNVQKPISNSQNN
jgi:hypothetical protein